eukprot:6726531-Alexandrium_andersonii.AAC.1
MHTRRARTPKCPTGQGPPTAGVRTGCSRRRANTPFGPKGPRGYDALRADPARPEATLCAGAMQQ